jgi:hypothetical protein
LQFFEENSILPLPERLESSGWQFLKVEVSRGSPEKSVKIGKSRPINRALIRVNRTARRGDRKNVRALRLPRREIWPEARRAR